MVFHQQQHDISTHLRGVVQQAVLSNCAHVREMAIRIMEMFSPTWLDKLQGEALCILNGLMQDSSVTLSVHGELYHAVTREGRPITPRFKWQQCDAAILARDIEWCIQRRATPEELWRY